MDARPNALRIVIDSTEIGILAATVKPAFSPTYTVTAPKITPKIEPKSSARIDNSFRSSFAGTKGRKVVCSAIRQGLLSDTKRLLALPRSLLHSSSPGICRWSSLQGLELCCKGYLAGDPHRAAMPGHNC